MRNIRLDFEYDGSEYYGYQRQPTEKTVQGELERVLNILTGEKVNLVTSGRTDRGVHALGQVANFKTDGRIEIEKIERALNMMLPKSILIHSVKEVDDDFHARFCAKSRSYLYKIKIEKSRTAFDSRYFTYVKQDIEIESLKKILKPLIGRHNFDSFRKAKCSANSPIREIKEIDVYKCGEEIVIFIEADAFLRSMVRIVVGTALALYFGDVDNNYIDEKLKKPDREGKKIVAPENGLYLYRVNY